MLRDKIGEDGFHWCYGVVEDRFDPLFLGRAKVRWVEKQEDNKEDEPTEKLPWSIPLLPLDSGRMHVTGVKEGDHIFGFFMDGPLGQQPVMVGTYCGIPEEAANPEKGFFDPRPDSILSGHQVPREPLECIQHEDGSGNDIFEISPKSRYPDKRFLNEPETNRLERGLKCHVKNTDGAPRLAQTIVGKKISDIPIGQALIPTAYHLAGTGSDKAVPGYKWTELQTPYHAVYPYNHVYYSEGGHVIEIDDTPKHERLHWYHRSGTFREIHPKGHQVEKIVGDEQHIVLRSRFTHIEANDAETVDWGKKLYVNKDGKSGCHYDLTVGAGSNFNIYTKKGELNIYINGDVNISASGNVTVECAKNLSAKVHGNADLVVDHVLHALVEEYADITVNKDLKTYVKGNMVTVVDGDYSLKAKNIITNATVTDVTNATTITRNASGNMQDSAGLTWGATAKSSELKADVAMSLSAGQSCTLNAPKYDVNTTSTTMAGEVVTASVNDFVVNSKNVTIAASNVVDDVDLGIIHIDAPKIWANASDTLGLASSKDMALISDQTTVQTHRWQAWVAMTSSPKADMPADITGIWSVRCQQGGLMTGGSTMRYSEEEERYLPTLGSCNVAWGGNGNLELAGAVVTINGEAV